MEILVLLKPEEFASIQWTDADAALHPDILLVNHDLAEASNEASNEAGASALLVRARGITGEVIALLRRRAEVADVRMASGALLIELNGDADSAPIVSLLVESGVEIEEVHRREKRFEELLNRLLVSSS